MQFKDQKKMKAVTFSYDDVTTQDIMLVELLNKYGLKSTFNVNSGLLGTTRILQRNGIMVSHYKLSESDVKYVYEGHEVAAHTLTHPHLFGLDKATLISQIEDDRQRLEELVGYDVVGFAYPYGDVDDEIVDVIKNNTKIKYARTTARTKRFDPQTDLLRFDPTDFHMNFDRLMELGQKFIEMKPDSPQIVYVWGHSFELDDAVENRARLEEFFKLISGHDDIFYGTNREVLL